MKFDSGLAHDQISQGFGADLVNKRDLATRLTELYRSLDGGSVCLLEGRWGVGKTTFVRQWAFELQKAGIESVYFDAFEADFLESPFEAVAGAFVTAALEKGKADDSAYQNFLSKAAKVGKAIGSVSARVGLKVATAGALDLVDLGSVETVFKDVGEGSGDIAEEAVKAMLSSHADNKVRFQELRRALEDIPHLLGAKSQDNGEAKVVVFVDELDRCRPDFALGIIEVLKHFFRADGLHFVLVANRSYLELSVDHKYGSGLAAHEYLQKFYDFTVNFEHTYDRNGFTSLTSFILTEVRKYISDDGSRSDFEDYIVMFSLASRMTLREIKNYVANASLAYLSVRNKFGNVNDIFSFAFMSMLRLVQPQTFLNIKNKRPAWKAVCAVIDSLNFENDTTNISTILQYYLDEDINPNDEVWRGYARMHFRTDRTSYLSNVASSVEYFGGH